MYIIFDNEFSTSGVAVQSN